MQLYHSRREINVVCSLCYDAWATQFQTNGSTQIVSTACYTNGKEVNATKHITFKLVIILEIGNGSCLCMRERARICYMFAIDRMGERE